MKIIDAVFPLTIVAPPRRMFGIRISMMFMLVFEGREPQVNPRSYTQKFQS